MESEHVPSSLAFDRQAGRRPVACRQGTPGAALLARGRALLERGALAHTRLWYLAEAIALRLEEGRPDDAERLADELQQPPSFGGSVVWAEHHAQTGRALAQWARGDRSVALREQIERLRVRSGELAYGELQARLAAALAGA